MIGINPNCGYSSDLSLVCNWQLPTAGILLSEVLMYYLIHMLKCPQLEDVKRVANRGLPGKGQSPDSLVAVAKIRLQGHVSAWHIWRFPPKRITPPRVHRGVKVDKKQRGFPPLTHTYFSSGQTWFSTREEDHLARPLSTMVFDRTVISGRYMSVYIEFKGYRCELYYRATTIINNWVNELRGRWYVPTDSYIRRPTSDTHIISRLTDLCRKRVILIYGLWFEISLQKLLDRSGTGLVLFAN